MKKLVVTMLLCMFATSVVQAKNIIFVTNDSTAETGSLALQNFLTSEGHTLTVGDFGSARPDAATLAANDLIIVAHETNSGSYDDEGGVEAQEWNALTLPIINLSSFIQRSSRWGYVDGSSLTAGDTEVADGFDNPYLEPAHPFLAGVSSTTMFDGGAVRWESPVDTQAIPAGATHIASVTTSPGGATGYGIVYIPAGSASFGHGTFGGRRIMFNIGAGVGASWDMANSDAEQILRNMIAEVPEPATVSLLAVGGLATVLRRRKR